MITTKLLLIIFFVLMIHAIETLAYATRLSGARVGQVATAISLFNILVIFSRFGIMFQQPFTGNLADQVQDTSGLLLLEEQYRLILFASTFGTIIGIILFPTFISIFTKSILKLANERGDIPRFLQKHAKKTYVKRGLKQFHFPILQFLKSFRLHAFPKRLFLFNVLVTAIYTTGILSALYAGALVPDYDKTASVSSGIINGIATMLLVLFVDPKISVLADDVAKNKEKYPLLKTVTIAMVFARLLGTLIAQLLLIPFAHYVAWFAKMIDLF
ncbi:lipid II flippase Amj family protein [Bacillus kexueae]|uniref:lipid II flippase Amj family protein n=1 Tax=Aeribacillus kexueae TaxID=2078952 RepID=UPI001FAF9E7E|nr:lipid II flippase Amj family protein [Bacillus kexueae]